MTASLVMALLSELAQVTDPDYINDAGRIIGSADAGPKPQHSGDRGGYAQFLTFFMLVAAFSFIGWRISREGRRSQANRSQR